MVSRSRLHNLSLVSLSLPFHIKSLFRTKCIICNETNPYEGQASSNHKIANIRASRHIDVLLRQLEPQSIIDDAQNDSTPSHPTMHIPKRTSLPMLLEIKMLQYPHSRLHKYNNRRDKQPNYNMRMYRIAEQAEVVRNPNTQRHAANQHDQPNGLDGRMHGRNLFCQIRILQERYAVYGQVDGYGAEGEEDDEDDGHDAGVCVSLAGEDLVGIIASLLEEAAAGGIIARLEGV